MALVGGMLRTFNKGGWGLASTAALCALLVAGCRGEEAAQPPVPTEHTTRFDTMEEQEVVVKKRPPSVGGAVAAAERLIDSSLDRVMTIAVGSVLTETPTNFEDARGVGEAVGTATREGRNIVFRLGDAKHRSTPAVFASVRAGHSAAQPCWSALWRPSWLPTAMSGVGEGTSGKATLVWWRFEQEDGPPYLVRFGPDGVALWRPDAEAKCYRGESLLGLIGGAERTFDYLSPVVLTGGGEPVNSEDTLGSKPLRVDLLPMKGKEQLIARNGRVELRNRRNRRLYRWSTTLPRGSAACTQAAVHQFDTDPPRLFFEIEYTDDDACDEVWEKREVQQTLFELDGNKLVPLLSGSASVYGEGAAASGSDVSLDVRIPSGDGELRYVGRGKTRQDEAGGDKWFDCSLWASDQGLDAADAGFTEDEHQGVWTFVVDGEARPVADVSVLVRTFQCAEVDGDGGDDQPVEIDIP